MIHTDDTNDNHKNLEKNEIDVENKQIKFKMPTDGTFYLMFNQDIEINKPMTFDTVTINWIKDPNFNFYYHEENMYVNEIIRKHTIRLVKNLEEIHGKKINYVLSKKVILQRPDPDTIGYIY